MLRVGLTGGIAAGKSAVSDALAEHGAVIIDADILAREVVESGTPGLRAVVARFGAGVQTADGRLDRDALARLVFADAESRRALEQIVHPLVRIRAAQLEAAAAAHAVVVHVIPLLVETGQAAEFDVVVVVDVEPEVQIQRLRDRSGLTEAEARTRIAAQASRRDRLAAADTVVLNHGSRADLEQQVARLWRDLRSRATSD
ncbi:MAG: dephospho-CoA kinase [Microlunatus sp.]|nr:dephospho-CoA kinase [Microlunatus sp.]MDN5770462.1 dephospho-CoA kinase [Microlunatus sp.]